MCFAATSPSAPLLDAIVPPAPLAQFRANQQQARANQQQARGGGARGKQRAQAVQSGASRGTILTSGLGLTAPAFSGAKKTLLGV